MDKIPSFTIDHTRLRRGIFVSRRDVLPSGDELTTFDIRMTEPNRQSAIDPRAMHAIEHLAATFLRNHPDWASEVVYWGPMGCMTGNYLILRGHLEPTDILPLMRQTMTYVRDFDDPIPGATPRDCGNYSYMDADGARRAAAAYLEVLDSPTSDNLIYPE